MPDFHDAPQFQNEEPGDWDEFQLWLGSVDVDTEETLSQEAAFFAAA